MGWSVKFADGQRVSLDTLTVRESLDVTDICDIDWIYLLNAPLVGDGKAMGEIYKLACRRTGHTAQVDITSVAIAAMFEDEDQGDKVELPTWKIDLPSGETIDTKDLAHVTVVDLATQLGTSWMTIVHSPMTPGRVMWGVYERLTDIYGGDPPSDSMTMATLADRFTKSDTEADTPVVPAVDVDPQTVDAPQSS